MQIRQMAYRDRAVWAQMRSALWPEYDEDHLPELDKYFDGKSKDLVAAFVAEQDDIAVGFIELNIRSFVEGSHQDAVPFIEAWFVTSEYRGRGLGKALMLTAQEWALSLGYSELGSDTNESNALSIRLHQEFGFEETARVVCFLKQL